MTIFDILGDVLTKKSGKLDNEYDFNSVMSNFMVCRYLSMKDNLVPFAEILNKVQTNLSASQFYKLAYKIVPQQKVGYIKYYATKQKKGKR